MFTEEGCITAGTANVRDRQRVGVRWQLAPEYIHTGEEDTEVRGGKHRRVAAALSARARAFLT